MFSPDRASLATYFKCGITKETFSPNMVFEKEDFHVVRFLMHEMWRNQNWNGEKVKEKPILISILNSIGWYGDTTQS